MNLINGYVPSHSFLRPYFRLTNESIEQLVGKENGSTDEILAKLTNQGVIDDLIGALRGTGDYCFSNRTCKRENYFLQN